MLLARLAVATSGVLLAGATVAQAAPALRVTNLGQSSAPVEVGQPPIDIAAAGGCAHPFTLAGESGCPPGTWPQLGRQWGLIEDVAGGDTLRLELSSPVSTVTVGSTSNYEPGLRDPGGTAIPNYDVLAESSATPTADPAVWQVTLPPLDRRAISTIGYTFSVVAQDESGYHDYPFGIRSPRYANELTRCGTAYFSTGDSQDLCLDGEKGPPPFHPRPRFSDAAYDGRVLTLQARVPAAGVLRVAVPTECREGNGGACHRRAWLSKHSEHAGKLVLRRALSLRLGASRRMTVQARFRERDGASGGTVSVRVRSVERRHVG